MNNSDFQEVINFIRNLFNQPEATIPLHSPTFFGNEKKYLAECVDTTFVSSVGKFVDRFEAETARYVGSKYAIAVINGTAALHMAMLLAKVKPGDEVITQSLTFVATVNAIKHANATPIFIDVDKDNMGMSPEKLEHFLKNNTIQRINNPTSKPLCINKITNKPITAIVPMHTFGHPCRIDEVVRIANEYNITVVEDAAESLGSFYKGQHTGTFGKLGTFSYNGNKTITTGGGGMIVTDDFELAQKAKHLTTTAKIPHSYEFIHDEVGYNYRLPNINAALGLAQMEQLVAFLESKRRTAEKYKAFFSSTDYTFVTEPRYSHSNYWLNAIIFANKTDRDTFLEYTNKNGIMTRPVWRLMNKLDMFKDCQKGDLSVTEWLEERIVNIPSSCIE